jgi:hypothetical protein
LGEQFSITESYGYLDVYQKIPNYGVLEGRLAYSNLHEPPGTGTGTVAGQTTGFNQAYGRLTLKDFQWGRGVLQASAGDQFFLLSDLPIRFTNFFYPQIYFRGFGAQYAHPSFQVYLLGGDVTLSRGLAGETFQGVGESLYGFMSRIRPWDRLVLEGSLFATQDEKDYSGNLVTKNNRVYRLAYLLRTWSTVYSAGEFMQSFSQDPQSRSRHDVAYRWGSIWKGDWFRLETNYRYIGPNFHLINEIYQPDKNIKGQSFAGEVRPWPFLSITGSLDLAKNNFVADPRQSLTDNESRSLGVGIYRAPWPSLYIRYYESNLSSRSDFPVAVRGHMRSMYGEINKKVSSLDIYGRYERFEFSDQINPGSSYRKDVPLLGVRNYHKKFFWYVEGEYDRFNPPSQGAGFEGLYLKVGGNYLGGANWNLYGELSYRPSSRRFGGQLGVYWQLPYGLRVRAYGRLEQGTSGAGDFINEFQTNQVVVEIVKAFSWGKKTDIAGLKGGQEWLGSGKIEGWVFNDVNVNLTLDTGEEGVEGIKVRLEDGSTTVTDKKGYYQFPAVAAGKHLVALEAKRIPAAYTFEGSETVAVEIRRRATARVDFPFVKGAAIRGRVLEDPKGTGKPDPKAKGVPDVLVLLKPGDLNTYTDSEGNFVFEGVIPRTYELSLHPETLPEYGRVTSAPTLSVTLTPGGQAPGLIFTVLSGERPIIFK